MIRKIKRLIYYLLYYISFPAALVFLMAVFLIKNKVVIRWACLKSSRIGHLSLDPAIYYLYRKNNISQENYPTIDIFYVRFDIANKTLINLWKKKLIFFPSTFMHAVDKIYQKTEIFYQTNNIHTIGMHNLSNKNTPKPPWLNRDISCEINKNKNVLTFSSSQLKKGYDFLNKLGIINKKYVCLYVRDEKYLNTKMPSNDWSHHSFRNSDINDFYECADYLTKQGFYVIRIGSIVNKSMRTNGNNMIIDYSTNGLRTDFLDIFLLANCSFCISTSGGLDNVSLIFNRPVLLVGVLPIIDMQTYYKKVLLSTKQIYSNNLKRNLTLKEIFDKKLGEAYLSKEYQNNNVNIIELTSKQITRLVIKMLDLIKHDFILDENEINIQNNFKEKFSLLFSKNSKNEIYHTNFRATFDPDFLERNPEWLN